METIFYKNLSTLQLKKGKLKRIFPCNEFIVVMFSIPVENLPSINVHSTLHGLTDFLGHHDALKALSEE